MLALIAAHFVLAACATPLVRWLGRRAFLVLALAPAATTVWAFTQWASVADGAVRTEQWRWAPALDLSIALRLDALGLLLTVLAGGVGTLVLVYCTGYFGDDEPGLANFAGTLTAFAGAMLGLVLADDLILLYVFWELTTVFSFLLIGHLSAKKANRRSALQALLVTTVGGLAMLVGLLMLGQAAGTYRISVLVAHPPPPGGTAVPVALVLVLAGALSKSAIWPFSLWLPGAMAAPTPVSAYLHAAAMVKGGIYLVARFSPAFAAVAPWRGVTLTLGAATMLLGGWRALRETDLKRILAYGTVSQLGFLTALVGAGSRYTALAGATMLLTHALFKAPLFLVVGIVDHATGSRDIRRLAGLARAMPVVCGTACLAGASMAGLPPFLGFVAKEASFAALWAGGTADRLTLYATVAGSALTTAYTLRFLYGAFGPATSPDLPRATAHGGRTKAALWAPTALLALAGLVLGPAVGRLAPLMERYAAAFPSRGTPYHLALWHGTGLPLTLSEIAWAAGVALFVVRNHLVRWGKRLALPSAEAAFAQILWQTERFALQLTGSIQRGSLPVYLGTALLVFSGAEAAALFTDRPWAWGGAPHLWDDAGQIAVAAAVAAAGVLCLPTRQRMKAVVLAGTTGYGTGVLFVLQGAPDLALTQFTVETTSIVVFVLVLRRLPHRFPPTATVWRRALHAALGVTAGTLAAGLTYLAVAARRHPAAGAAMVAETAHDGLKNVVATILVDLRAWDTMGESAVLAVAAVGVTSLVYLRRRAGALPRAQEDGSTAGVWASEVRAGPRAAPERTWLAAGDTLDPDRRSVVFEVVARLVFHPILVLSLYLLFCAENLPGGGFTAGLVAGLALVVRYLAGGRYELAEAAPVDAGFLLGTGLMISVGTGLGGLVLGSDVLDSAVFHTRLPLFGEVHVPSSVLFDFGVYLLVLGVVLDVLRSLGAKIDQQIEREEARRKA
ncbi:Na+/H+ antiporter subunit A [Streptomyces fildesensis]|uniref:Na+/H+ antiporter subunit A n=1 Tax=Streptomyces fildesensis TaxID=375757 RepID=A0ABW8CDD7_9ACTN